MINGKTEQFLDTGWFTEATIFYKGFIYWCEGYFDQDKVYHFFVNRWRAENENNQYYHSIVDESGDPLEYKRVLDISGENMDQLKREFLQSKVFDGSTFWEVEKELAWLDEGKVLAAGDNCHSGGAVRPGGITFA